jgi:hypothetical protein
MAERAPSANQPWTLACLLKTRGGALAERQLWALGYVVATELRRRLDADQQQPSPPFDFPGEAAAKDELVAMVSPSAIVRGTA